MRVSELFEDAGESGRAVAGLLTSSSNPKATLQWLARSSAAPILVEHVRSERVPSDADLAAIAVPVNSDGRAPHRQAVEFARAILVAAGVLPSRRDRVSRYELWAHRALKGIDRAGDRCTLSRLLGLHPNSAVAWINLTGGIYARYWQRLIDDDLAAGDDDCLESDGDLDEDRSEDDPLDILDELGLSGDSAF